MIINKGITQKTLNERFIKNNKLPYIFTKIKIKKGKLFTLYQLEQEIKHKYKKHRYIPHKKFNGYTECFTIECIDILQEYFK